METVVTTKINLRGMYRKESAEHHISVVMPVYNRVQFLQEAIESILNQEYTNFELIIVDDGSTLPEIKKMLRAYKDNPRIVVLYKQKNGGPGSAINFGALKVKDEYFCRLDSDDMLLPQALTALNEYINKYPNVSYFYSSRYVIDENSQIVITDWTSQDGIHRSQEFNREKLLNEYHCNHLICWKKKIF